MKHQDLPAGTAAMYEVTKNKVICILVESDGKENHRVPKFNMQIVPLAVGIAFIHPNDQGKFSAELGRVISLGRALKMYDKTRNKPGYITIGTGITYHDSNVLKATIK